MAPITCKADAPGALRYYAASLKPLLSLGPNATPGDVQRTLVHEFSRGLIHSVPMECQVYELAALGEDWQFTVAADPNGYGCSSAQLYPTSDQATP